MTATTQNTSAPITGKIRKVAIAPFFSDNPYQESLRQGLSQEGVTSLALNTIKASELSQFGPGEILHLHWPPQASYGPKTLFRIYRYLRRLKSLRQRGVTIVWTVHNLLPHESTHPQLDLWVARQIAALAHRLICHSPAAAKEAAKNYRIPEAKIDTIPHGNYVEAYPNHCSTIEARRALNLPQEDCVILCLGMIRPYKGVVELIEAFKKANPHQARLVIAGKCGGGLTDKDVEQAAGSCDKISLHLKFIPDSEIQTFMNAADLVAFPYRKSLTSGALILALSFSKAVLAYDRDTTRSTAGANGAVLIDQNEADGLSKALANLPPRAVLEQMGKDNFEIAKGLDWSTIARMTIDTYRAALTVKP